MPQAWPRNDNAAGDETHLRKDQLGTPNSLGNHTQPQARQPSKSKRHTNKLSDSLLYMAILCPIMPTKTSDTSSPPHKCSKSKALSSALSSGLHSQDGRKEIMSILRTLRIRAKRQKEPFSYDSGPGAAELWEHMLPKCHDPIDPTSRLPQKRGSS